MSAFHAAAANEYTANTLESQRFSEDTSGWLKTSSKPLAISLRSGRRSGSRAYLDRKGTPLSKPCVNVLSGPWKRKMIDWKNLQSLPLRRQRDTNDRERLAATAHAKHCAKHKGRNHWRNWERRKMIAENRRSAEAGVAKKTAASARYREAIRAYWMGMRADHP